MMKNSVTDITISSLDDFISAISRVRMTHLFDIDLRNIQTSKEEYATVPREISSKKLYFRGQSNKEWLIIPNVFRNNGLSCEAAMTHKSYLCSPEILNKHRTPFERLTLLQHYELGTRLLDITSNPLVALYFACQPCIINERITKKEAFIEHLSESNFSPEQIDILLEEFSNNEIVSVDRKDGAVYFKSAFAENFNKMEIQIISHLAEIDMSKQYNIKELLDSLLDKIIISSRQAVKLSANNYKELINILQSVYFVESNFNNQRLIKQDGSFLISGNINVSLIEGEFLLEKASGYLNSFFEFERIIIPEQYKETILNELDSYNINERSLFPEIDHQLRYIQMKCSENSHPVEKFSYYQKPIHTDLSQDSSINHAKSDKIKAEVNDSKIPNDLFILVKHLLTVDWEKSPTIKAKICKVLKRHLKYHKKLEMSEITQQCDEFYFELVKEYQGKTYTEAH